MGIGKRWEAFLWDVRPRRRWEEALRIAAAALWKFQRDGGPLRASALAFTTALGLVPLLALAFAVLKGMGVQNQLESLVASQLAAGNEQVAMRITEYVSRIRVGTLGLAGFSSLTLSALFVLHNIEQSFNDIWGVEKGRAIWRKITDYTAILVACPVLLLLSTSLVTTAHLNQVLGGFEWVDKTLLVVFSLAPLSAKCIAFAAMYLLIPNHRVGFWAAAIGGVFAAVFWHLAEAAYVSGGILMSRSNAVYGALAQLPAFLVWIYVGWCIVLAGAELCCVLELPGRGRYLRGGRELWSPRPAMALSLLTEVALRYEEGLPTRDQELIARAGIHPVAGLEVIGELVDAGLLTHTSDETPTLVPARSPENVPMSEVIARFSRLRGERGTSEAVETQLLADLSASLGAVSWGQWARSVDTARPQQPPPQDLG